MLTPFLRSLGLKRLVASWLNVIVEVLRAVPGTAETVASIEVVAGLFGITGLGHAGVSGTVTKKKIATASALVSVLLAASYAIPALAPFAPILQKAAAVLGAAAVGSSLATK